MDTQLWPDNFLTTRLKKVVNWSRRSSLWPMPFATACCGIELMSTAASRYDIARFGAEAMRFSPKIGQLPDLGPESTSFVPESTSRAVARPTGPGPARLASILRLDPGMIG